jgi:hypothetical protein
MDTQNTPQYCPSCRHFSPDLTCRNSPPDHSGFPKVRADYWCGKFDGRAITINKVINK